MVQSYSRELLAELGKLNSPTIANAIELFNVRPRTEGFASGAIRCVFPDLSAMVGYACTATIKADAPGEPQPGVTRAAMWEHVLAMPSPRVIVIQDEDDPKAIGSYWGEVNANVFKALGAVGVVTDGGVRDLDEVHPLRFHFFAREVIVSHAYVHLTSIGRPVTVGGLTINPGDLLHGDKHGVIQIPHSIAEQIPEAARRMEEYERPIIDFCKSSQFSVEGLAKLVATGVTPMQPAKGDAGGRTY